MGKIGLIDSGAGGLAVIRHIQKKQPRAGIIYLADTQYAPFGNKSPELLAKRLEAAENFLTEKGADHIILACNTLASIKRPTINLIDLTTEAAKRAGRPATLLATQVTVGSRAYNLPLDEAIVCPNLIAELEAGNREPKIEVARTTEAVILGCTHLSIIAQYFRDLWDFVFDSAYILANHILQTMILESGGLDLYETKETTSLGKIANNLNLIVNKKETVTL